MLVASFAVGRAQQLIYLLQILMGQKRIPELPIFLDSPMAVSGMNIYRYYAVGARPVRGPGGAPRFRVRFRARATGEHASANRKRINSVRGPAVIISSSGMMTGGRILHHLRQRLPEARNTIVLGGFMAAGTRGRALQDGAQLATRVRRRRAGAGRGRRNVGLERPRGPLGAAALARAAADPAANVRHARRAVQCPGLGRRLANRARLEHAGAQDGPARRIDYRIIDCNSQARNATIERHAQPVLLRHES